MTEQTAAITRAERPEFVCRSWPAHPQHLASLSDEVHRWLTPLHLSEDTERNVALAVGEAVDNCLKHAYTSFTIGNTVALTFWTEAGSMWIEVVDHGVWRSPDRGSTGRGLEIMRQLMPVILVHYDRRGTRVLLSHPLLRHPAPRPRAHRTAVRDATLAVVDLLGVARSSR